MGLELFVWGDTGEIRYCSDVGKGFYANGPLYNTNSLLQDEQPAEEQDGTSDEQGSEENTHHNALDPLTLGLVASLVAVPIITISVWTLKRKNGNNKQSRQKTVI